MACIARDFVHSDPPGPEWRPCQVQIFIGSEEFAEMYNDRLYNYRVMPNMHDGQELLFDMGARMISHVYRTYAETRYICENSNTWYKNTGDGWIYVTQAPLPVPVPVPRPMKRYPNGNRKMPNCPEPAAIPLVNINEMVKPVDRHPQRQRPQRRAPVK